MGRPNPPSLARPSRHPPATFDSSGENNVVLDDVDMVKELTTRCEISNHLTRSDR
jgi:hypothetical protein